MKAIETRSAYDPARTHALYGPYDDGAVEDELRRAGYTPYEWTGTHFEECAGSTGTAVWTRGEMTATIHELKPKMNGGGQ